MTELLVKIRICLMQVIAVNIRQCAFSPPSDTDIRKVAKSANVHSFIMCLLQGYDTTVGQNAFI